MLSNLLLLIALSPAQDHILESNVAIPMRDGTALATDLYFPAANGEKKPGKFPVILSRTPYNKANSEGRMYAAKGYVFINQDTRGRYASEGRWDFLNIDVNDGYDTAAWIVKQPWSSGKIGTIGTSYVGGTQHAIALSNAPGLAAVIPVDAVANAGYFGMRNSGAFELRFFNWIFTIGAPKGSAAVRDPGSKAALEELAANTRQYLLNLPLRKGTTPLKLAPEYEDWLIQAMTRSDNDAYWKQPGFNVVDQVANYKDVPAYIVGGWYDSWGRSTTMTFEALRNTKKSAVQLIMGPWIHGQQTRHAHGQVDFGEAAALKPEWRLRWYDRWLKNEPNGAENDAPVRIFVMGTGPGTKNSAGQLQHGGQWRDEREWPLARTKQTPYYIHSNGTLTPEPAGLNETPTSYTFDPNNPIPTIGGNISSGDGILLQGAWDQKCGKHVWNCTDQLPLSARRDILVFQTPPLEKDTEITGPIDVKLHVSSDSTDTDFTAKLIDVYPPSKDYPAGFDLNIADGIQRARYRDSLEHASLMEPNKIYEITVRMYPTSNVFKKGHRIRVDLSSSNFPRFDINPNTGEPLARHRRTRVATNTIHHDQQHQSHILLPVIP
ncbi:MAG: CocE/NonD family hydrolase [Acidobacteria bacterium]|nr:CocE/NonD family hydrolase [Acidobacteriota bacterium]